MNPFIFAAALFVVVPLLLMRLSRSDEGKRILWGIVILVGVVLVCRYVTRPTYRIEFERTTPRQSTFADVAKQIGQ